MKNFLKELSKKLITITRGSAEIPKTREVLGTPIREVEPIVNQEESPKERIKIGSDSLVCPYCASKNYIKRGFRQKKLERVQLMLCSDCGKTFTPHLVKGKHYPLAIIFDAISLYNLGYSLEESCKRTAPEVVSVVAEARDNSSVMLSDNEVSKKVDSSRVPQNDRKGGGGGAILGGDALNGQVNVGTGTRSKTSSISALGFFEEQTKNLLSLRMKIMRLQISWKKFREDKKDD